MPQKDSCAICGAKEQPPPQKRLSVDHDHSCCPGDKVCGKCIRGLLCSSCNLGLGMFADDPERLRTAADYVELSREHNKSNLAIIAFRGKYPETVIVEIVLRKFLASSPKPLLAIKELAQVNNFSWNSMQRAKAKLGIISIKAGFPAKVVGWKLPDITFTRADKA